MHADAFDLFNAPEPFATAGWCGTCAACAATRRRPTHPCGCPVGHRRKRGHSDSSTFVAASTVSRSGAGPVTPSCLHALGRRLSHGLYHGAAPGQLPLLKGTHVLSEAVAVVNRRHRSAAQVGSKDLAVAGLTHHQALVLVTSHLQRLVAADDLSRRTVNKVVVDLGSLAEFMTSGLRRPLVSETCAADLARWIDAPLGGRRRNGQEAAATTRRLRRSSARLYFRVLRNLGMFTGDPTLDIAVHPGVAGTTLPLADSELLQLRYACISLNEADRLPSCLALAESTATTGEMAKAQIDDVDLVRERVWLRGDARRRARWVPLSPWATRKLGNRIDFLRSWGAAGSTLVVYGGAHDATASESPGASTAGAMGDLFRRAGLAGEPGIKPGSVGLGFALRVWNEHGDIRLVARALGYRDYNKAADAIGVDPEADFDDDTVTEALRAGAVPETAVKHQIGKHRSGRAPRRPAAHASKATTALTSDHRTSATHD